MTVSGECICGAVRITVPNPAFVNDCNCSLCFRLGVLWAYYPMTAVTVSGPTISFTRSDVRDPSIVVHHCGNCGATTHWSPYPGSSDDRLAVNARLFDYGTLDGVEVRHGDERSGKR